MNLADALDIHARARPTHPALIDGTLRMTHAEFAGRVRRMAAWLQELGLPAEDPVGICLRDTAEHVVALYAVARSGRAILPMDARWTVEEQRNIAHHFGASLVLLEADMPPLPGLRCSAPREASAVDAAAARFASDAEAPFVLSLSSGTTGRPKGPLIAHRHFLARFRTHWINLGLNGRDRFVCATPLYFGGGRTFAMSVLFSGGTLILKPPPCTPEELVACVAAERATSLFLVPTQFRRLLALDDDALVPLRGLNLLFSSGAPLSAEERRIIRDRMCPRFFEYYASTEGGGVSLLTPDDIATHAETVGRPVFAVEVEVVDAADQPLPPGETGLLRYRGPACATSYHRDPEASAEAFRDGWFYPGDLASLNAEGFVTLRGRHKDMIIRGGINIHPADIEAALNAHPDVAESAAVGWSSPEFGEEIAVFVRLVGPADQAALLAFARSRLPRPKWPRAVFVVDDLPRNSAGKVLKRDLAMRLPRL
ncbi:class I adenylate-forming enzyme family protein [Roseomonas sp. HF4]|uniref:class I adenylate-forming enzyme family protein n=1 Tax=Roseomonas sp. HF4 TaxID=2562313 RepID=UPI0010BFFA8D|nr:AMP-binding protein [Roseomonas sp. HF4]